MTRNLKLPMAAALALLAFGVIGVAGAQAAGELFHCSVGECRLTAKQDGTSKTAHQVLLVENANATEDASLTCDTVSGEARYEGKTIKEVTLTNIKYESCTLDGSPGVTVDMNECDYLYTSEGTVNKRAIVHVKCPEREPEKGKKVKDEIQVTVRNATGGLECTFSFPEQTLEGVSFHNIGEEAKTTTEVTVETAISGMGAKITVTATGTKAGCGINPSQVLTGTYMTGNAVVTGESEAGAMANAWWK